MNWSLNPETFPRSGRALGSGLGNSRRNHAAPGLRGGFLCSCKTEGPADGISHTQNSALHQRPRLEVHMPTTWETRSVKSKEPPSGVVRPSVESLLCGVLAGPRGHALTHASSRLHRGHNRTQPRGHCNHEVETSSEQWSHHPQPLGGKTRGYSHEAQKTQWEVPASLPPTETEGGRAT